jgi:hypothetical protein
MACCMLSVMLSLHWIIMFLLVFGTLFSILFACSRYERLAGRRSIDDYPPIRRLLQAGWKYPSNNWASSRGATLADVLVKARLCHEHAVGDNTF